MQNISADEYALVAQALLKSQAYVKQNEKRWNPQTVQEIQSRFSDAMGAMQAVSKKMKDKGSVPSRGSSISKEDKIKVLFQTFTLKK